MDVFKKHKSLSPTILLILVFIYLFKSLLTLDPITTYDDSLLLNGVKHFSSIQNYLRAVYNGDILDLQPIRDISYLADLKIKSLFYFYGFHTTNLFIWFLICITFKNILRLLGHRHPQQKYLLWSIVFLYSLSPVAFSSVAWIAARKHLLSTLFIMLATHLVLQGSTLPLTKKRASFISTLFLFSLLSQPINILWPCFVSLYSFTNKKIGEHKKLLIILFSFSLLAAIANFYYYTYIYNSVSGGDGKYDSQIGLGLSLLAIGRYFFLTLWPFDALPVSHYQGAWQNIIGLFLLVPFIYLCFKKAKTNPNILTFLVYFFLPLLPVVTKITRIFCSDTYLLNASAGVYIVIYLLLLDQQKKIYSVLILIYALFLGLYNLNYLHTFESSENIWQYSYTKEPTAFSIENLAAIKLQNNQYKEADLLIQQLGVLDPNGRFYIKLKSDLINNNPEISVDKKVYFLENLNPKRPVIYLRLALLYSNLNNIEEFKKNITMLFSNPLAYIAHSYINNERALALIKVACEKNNVAETCHKLFLDFNKQATLKNWNKSEYESFYFEFKKNPNNLSY